MAAWFAHVPRIEARAAMLSLGVSIVLMAVKFVAYFFTGSAAVFSDALESIANVAASAMGAYAIYYAHQPADENHPYGHGKIEFLSSGLEGGMILLAGLAGVVKALDGFRHSAAELQRLDLGLALMAFALFVNGVVGIHLIQTGRRQRSIALVADGHHLLSDAITSVVAVGALLAVRFTRLGWMDPLSAVGVSLYIGFVGVNLLRHGLAGLMDKQDVEDERLLRGILDSHLVPDGRPPLICNYHKLRHRHSGRYHWVDFHIMLPADWNIDQGHRIATEIENEIQAALKEGNATAHVEPCLRANCQRCAGRTKILEDIHLAKAEPATDKVQVMSGG